MEFKKPLIVGGFLVLAILAAVFFGLISIMQTEPTVVFGGKNVPTYSYQGEILATDSLSYKDAQQVNVYSTNDVELIPVMLAVDGVPFTSYVPPVFCTTDFCQRNRPSLVEKTWQEHNFSLPAGTHKIQILSLQDWSAYLDSSGQIHEWSAGQWGSQNWKYCWAENSERCNRPPCAEYLATLDTWSQQNLSCHEPSLKNFCLENGGNQTGLCRNIYLVNFVTLKEWTVTVPSSGGSDGTIPPSGTSGNPFDFLTGIWNWFLSLLFGWWPK